MTIEEGWSEEKSNGQWGMEDDDDGSSEGGCDEWKEWIKIVMKGTRKVIGKKMDLEMSKIVEASKGK